MPDGPQETAFGQPLRAPPSRWDEVHKLIPIIFVLGTMAILYFIYVFVHCLPLMQQPDDDDARFRGLVELVVFNIISFFLVSSYIVCTMVHPGDVPQDWVFNPNADTVDLPTVEVKKKGGVPRHCKKCGKYKPDRCHHCRVCGTCILKMDHHCPWINNCVGHHNYKYFLLLLFYTMLDTHLIFWTISESMLVALDQDAPFLTMFFLLFGLSISFFLAFLVTAFLGLHIWLVCQGLSTIEFCEQVLPTAGTASCWCCIETDSMWDLGCIRNFQSVLGDNPFLWLVPFAPPRGDGLSYEQGQQHKLLGPPPPRDLEANRGSRRKTSSKKLLPTPPMPIKGYEGYGSMPYDVSYEPAVQYHYQRQPYCIPRTGTEKSYQD